MNYEELINDISHINNTDQAAVVRAINQIQTIRNWFIGAYIVEYEQNGVDRAAYGTQLIKKLADDLKNRHIQGLSDRNLKNFRQFALTYPGLAKNDNLSAFLPLISLPVSNFPIRQTVSAEFKTIPQNLFPALEAREQQQPSLSWQNNSYYQHLFTTFSWSHILELTRIEDTTKRAFYELECIKGNWSTI